MMSLQSVSPDAENALHKMNRSCQNFYATFASQAVAIKRSNESWVKISTQLANYSKQLQKHLEKDIHVIVSFPFQRFLDGILILSKKPTTQLIPLIHKKSSWREISLFDAGRESSPETVVGTGTGWCARALKACESQCWICGRFVELISFWRI